MVVKTNTVNFEEALNLTGFGKFNFLMQLVNISLIMGMAFEIVSVAYLVPASACELNTTNFQQGFMAGMPLLGIIATSHFWGYLADTRGRRKILAWCMSLAFLAGASAALSPDWIVFSVLKFLSSCAVAGTYALALTLLSECTPQHRRAIMVALTSSIFLCATGLMAVISIPVLQLKFSYYIPYLNIEFTSWRLLNLVFATPCALGAVGMYFSYESPRFLLSVGEEEKALKVLKGIYMINTGKSGDDYNVSSVVLGEDTGKPSNGFWSSLVAQTVPLMKPPLLKNTLLLSVMFVIVYFGINPFLTWLPYIADGVMKAIERGDDNLSFCDMLRSSHNETATENQDCSLNSFAMVTVFVISVTIAALNTFLSAIINYIGRKRMLIGVQLFAGIAGLCINLTSSWMVSTILLVAFMTGVLNFGFLSTFSVDIFPTYVKAMAVCLTLMVGRGSSVFGINILKHLLVYDCELAFYIFGGLTFVGGIIGFLLPSDTKTVSKKATET
ncbi:putative transporter svop-1 [Vanessa atalanta]|uniref:putative transporter svop-1 n=1 Tax=Vanessa atalanta TaxID=42275 RepID=UPI001FCDA84D|nr:putative transporter svop-1 [Vanessa atalanta]XP_047531707.1 putative transporter svop-1 [Vanessa atalanta]